MVVNKKEDWFTLSSLIWLLLLLELLVACLALIVGRSCGYRPTFLAFSVLGGIVGFPVITFVVVKIIKDALCKWLLKKRMRVPL